MDFHATEWTQQFYCHGDPAREAVAGKYSSSSFYEESHSSTPGAEVGEGEGLSGENRRGSARAAAEQPRESKKSDFSQVHSRWRLAQNRPCGLEPPLSIWQTGALPLSCCGTATSSEIISYRFVLRHCHRGGIKHLRNRRCQGQLRHVREGKCHIAHCGQRSGSRARNRSKIRRRRSRGLGVTHVIRTNAFSPDKGLSGEIWHLSQISVNFGPLLDSTLYFTFFYVCIIIIVIILWCIC